MGLSPNGCPAITCLNTPNTSSPLLPKRMTQSHHCLNRCVSENRMSLFIGIVLLGMCCLPSPCHNRSCVNITPPFTKGTMQRCWMSLLLHWASLFFIGWCPHLPKSVCLFVYRLVSSPTEIGLFVCFVYRLVFSPTEMAPVVSSFAATCLY